MKHTKVGIGERLVNFILTPFMIVFLLITLIGYGIKSIFTKN